MAYENKTKATEVSVDGFIANLHDEAKRDDARKLVEIFKSKTAFDPKMWGPTIIGFGSYHYKYASGHEGDAPLAAFSPRKDAIVLYFSPEFERRETLLEKLGKHKTGKGCVYVKRLSDVDEAVISQLVVASVDHIRKSYP